MTTIITCEHAGNEVPAKYATIFKGLEEILQSHRGWDPGALEVARHLSSQLNAPLLFQPITRLLIEMNRSLDSSQLFSPFSITLPPHQRQQLLQEYYHPYRSKVEASIAHAVKPVLHLSIHSFTPVWDGAERKTDIGLLFDPGCSGELDICNQLQQKLNQRCSLQIDFNKPYLGTDDGFTTYLRTVFTNDAYIGIEIEVNQKFVNEINSISNLLSNAIALLK